MLRVLLASNDKQLVKQLEKELLEQCRVEACCHTEQLPDLLRTFDPDVVLLDAQLPGENVFAAIRGIRQSFRNVGIVTISTLLDDCTVQRLIHAGVNHITGKPCKVEVLVSHILEIGTYVRNRSMENPENIVDSILLDLGFRMGLHSYRDIKEAILAYSTADANVQMKYIYYLVTKHCGGTAQQKEKSLRDGIKSAAKRGSAALWKLYFPPGGDGIWRCPTNEEFVGRIAACIHTGGREKLPYDKKNIAI